MKIITIKQFKDRAELDNFIRVTYGEDPVRNSDITIEEGAKELTRLLLSEERTVYGIKVRKKGK